ncbi:MAG: type II toxin-antitoxin system death-on-curing family toxin [Alphaproteobacteria bacterium]|nr:MAG: type II toxin-antitoxin system death-on-curing family toxin [Alphaproteobacteria bacterium]
MTEPIWLLKPVILAAHNMMISRFGGSPGIRDEGLLDSALARPVNLYHHENMSDITRLAASYAAGIIKNHAFVDGHKRTGFIAAYTFLDINGETLQADEISATTMTFSLESSEVSEIEYATWLTQNISA